MRTDNLDDDPVVDLARRVRALEKGNNLGYSSISEGSLRVASMEGLIVEGSERVTGILIVDGTLQVTGTESVSGTLVISGAQIVNGTLTSNGTFNNTGPFNNTGKLTQNGDADLNGNTKIAGNTEITGTTTLRNDLNVTGNGRVKVGSMMLDPTIASGAMTFSNGAQVFTNGDTIQVFKGNGVVQLSETQAKLQLGGSAVVIDGDGVHIYGPFFVHNPPTVSDDANASIDADSFRVGITDD